MMMRVALDGIGCWFQWRQVNAIMASRQTELVVVLLHIAAHGTAQDAAWFV